jgi:hypothetical protein
MIIMYKVNEREEVTLSHFLMDSMLQAWIQQRDKWSLDCNEGVTMKEGGGQGGRGGDRFQVKRECENVYLDMDVDVAQHNIGLPSK